ncbi:hypothetical protein [Borrelia persica]|nr:hypothetical protein [Borrelia persica]
MKNGRKDTLILPLSLLIDVIINSVKQLEVYFDELVKVRLAIKNV